MTDLFLWPLFQIHFGGNILYYIQLGWLYSDETKPWYDSRKAIESWSKAAELGSGESMYDMGLFLFNGRKDLKADPVTAKKWMERAAAAGQKDAKIFLKLLESKG